MCGGIVAQEAGLLKMDESGRKPVAQAATISRNPRPKAFAILTPCQPFGLGFDIFSQAIP